MTGVLRVALGAAMVCGVVCLSAQQGAVFRGGTETVPVYVTVLGPDGRLVTDLTVNDFEVSDNGRPQKITLFDATLQPVSIVIMLDMSGSMSGNIRTLRSAAVQMFTRLLPGDKARIGNFGNRIDIEPNHFTNDVDELTRALWLDLEPGGPTPLWGAINAAMAALARLEGRRVVLVLTDGKNTGLRGWQSATEPTLAEVLQRAESEDFMVYSIGMRSSGGAFPGQAGRGMGGRGGFNGGRGGRGAAPADEPDPGIRTLADASGGGYFELRGTSNLGEVFAKVADELHRQYLIGYAMPEADGKVHRIEIHTTNAALQSRARRTYVAAGKR